MRINSIDIFRGLTMFLMIFVNDLWSIESYPAWLGHSAAEADGMGFSDVIFPAFLFIVGLSIPFALDKRLEKGENKQEVYLHVIFRGLSLLLMGFFIVNYENINASEMVISKYVWEIIMIGAFFLLWVDFSKIKTLQTIPLFWYKIFGGLILIVLAFLYRGNSANTSLITMQPHWWGILGLIGWSYLYGGIAYLLTKGKLIAVLVVSVLFLFLNIQEFWFPELGIGKITFMESASHYSLVWLGVLATVLLQKLELKKALAWIFVLGGVCIAMGMLFRPLWGISKIYATPSWTFITAGISFIVFGVLYFLADIKHITKWAKPFAPAGRSTLTCYLIPYIWYGIVALSEVHISEWMKSGPFGVIKCLVFASIIVLLTRLFEKMKLQLRL